MITPRFKALLFATRINVTALLLFFPGLSVFRIASENLGYAR